MAIRLLRRGVMVALILILAASPMPAADPPPGDNPNSPTPPPPDGPLPPLGLPSLLPGVELTPKNLLPRPWTDFRFRRSSGQVPTECRKLDVLKDGRVMDCWLEHNAQVRNAIQWHFGDRLRRWSDWTASEKTELRRTFVHARNWRAGGFGVWPGPTFDDPPINREEPFLGADARTVLDPTAARDRYMAQVAFMLAAEIDAWVSWSLLDYSPEVLGELLTSYPHQYARDQDDGSGWDSVYPGGYVVGGFIVHAHAVTAFRFLHSNGIIGATPRVTIARLMEWSRDHMQHSFNLPAPARLSSQQELEAFWHYRGGIPVARIIEGTEASYPTLGVLYPGIHSWTNGCSGTTRFFRSVLRVVNIPVRELITRDETCGHFLPYFVGEGLYLSHGDDPYAQWFRTGAFTGDDLLINSDLWHRWFHGTSDGTHCPGVGRRVVELNIPRPSEAAVTSHCRDLRAGMARSTLGRVMETVGQRYTTEQLDTLGFWGRLDALALTSTDFYCEAWRAGR